MRCADGTRLVCQIEQAYAQSAKDGCLRVSFHRIASQDSLEAIFDLIIIDPSLLKQSSHDEVCIREDTKFELGIGYRDTLASIFKMDDISNDIAFSKVQLPAEFPKIEPRKDPWSLVYRKVVRQNNFNYIVSAMQHENSQMLKLNVFESMSMQQQIFVFNSEDVLTVAECQESQKKPEIFKDLIKMAVN